MNVALKIAVIAAGYVVAVIVATIVTVAFVLAPSALPDNGAYGTIYGNLDDLPAMLAVGFIWTFPCALPGFIAAILLGERQGWDGWLAYALAGMANAAPSFAIFAAAIGSPFETPMMVVGAFPGGFAGGAVYWFTAGRLVARWRYVAAEAA